MAQIQYCSFKYSLSIVNLKPSLWLQKQRKYFSIECTFKMNLNNLYKEKTILTLPTVTVVLFQNQVQKFQSNLFAILNLI